MENTINATVEETVKAALKSEKKKKGKKKLIVFVAIVVVIAIAIASISLMNNSKSPEVEVVGMYVDESYDDESSYALYMIMKMTPEGSENLILDNASVEISVGGNEYQDSYVDYTDKAVDSGCYDHNIYRVLRLLEIAQLPQEVGEEQEIAAGDTDSRYYATKFIVSKKDVDDAGKAKLEFYPCYAIDMLDIRVRFKADLSEVVFVENAEEMGMHIYKNIENLPEDATYLTAQERYEISYY